MANLSDLTRKEQVLRYLQDHLNAWVDGPELANEMVGGSEGLKRLRELRDDGHRIVMRPHPNKSRDIFQYKLVVPETIHPSVVGRVTDLGTYVFPEKAAGSSSPVTSGARPAKPSVAKGETPLRWNDDTGYWEATKEVCPDCGGVYEDETVHRKGNEHRLWEEKKAQFEFEQQQIAIDPQPIQYKFTELPTKISMENATLCPRCKGYRLPERKESVRRSRTGLKIVTARPAESFTRDPYKPSNKDKSPNRCPRCNGFGVVPNVGV